MSQVASRSTRRPPSGATLLDAVATVPLSLPASPLLDVDATLRLLPADVRASVAWARKPFHDASARLRTEPLTDAMIADATSAAWKAIVSVRRALSEVHESTDGDDMRSRASDEMKTEIEQLAAFVDDDASRDTLEWITGFLRCFTEVVLSLPREDFVELVETLPEGLAEDEAFAPYIRGLVVLMAANDVRREGDDPARARDLIDVGFVELTKFRGALRRRGLSVSPFARETPEARARGLLASARSLRETLTDDDWRTLEEARLHDLR